MYHLFQSYTKISVNKCDDFPNYSMVVMFLVESPILIIPRNNNTSLQYEWIQHKILINSEKLLK